MSNRPVMSVTFRRGEQNYSVLSVWPGKFAGTYSVSRDKGTDKYPAISLGDVIRAFIAGEGFVNVRVTSEAGRGGSGGGYSQPQSASDYGDDDQIPF